MGMELRRFLRVSTPYRVEYVHFPFPGNGEPKTSAIKNIGAGGLLFKAHEPFSQGQQLVLKIFIPGWRLDGDDVLEAPDEDSEAPITALSEVRHCTFDPADHCWAVGIEFLGRILSSEIGVKTYGQ